MGLRKGFWERFSLLGIKWCDLICRRKTRQMKHGPLMGALMEGFERDVTGTTGPFFLSENGRKTSTELSGRT